MAKAMKRKPMVHKLYAGTIPFCWINSRYTACNLDLWSLKTPAKGHKTWRGVTCKNCLRRKPKKRGE